MNRLNRFIPGFSNANFPPWLTDKTLNTLILPWVG